MTLAIDAIRRVVLVCFCALVTITSGMQARAAEQGPVLNRIHQRGVLRVGWAVLYPSIYREPGHDGPVGYYVDIVQALGKAMNLKVVWVEDNWSTMMAGLQANRYDVTVPIAITAARAKSATFATPILQEPVGFVIRTQDAGKFKRWQDLNSPGVRISLTLGSDADMFANQTMTSAQLIKVRAAPDSITQLLMGRVEAWMNSTSALKMVVAEHKELQVLPGPAVGSSKIAFAISPGDNAWKGVLDQFSAQMLRSGELLGILHRYGRTEEYLGDATPSK